MLASVKRCVIPVITSVKRCVMLFVSVDRRVMLLVSVDRRVIPVIASVNRYVIPVLAAVKWSVMLFVSVKRCVFVSVVRGVASLLDRARVVTSLIVSVLTPVMPVRSPVMMTVDLIRKPLLPAVRAPHPRRVRLLVRFSDLLTGISDLLTEISDPFTWISRPLKGISDPLVGLHRLGGAVGVGASNGSLLVAVLTFEGSSTLAEGATLVVAELGLCVEVLLLDVVLQTRNS